MPGRPRSPTPKPREPRRSAKMTLMHEREPAGAVAAAGLLREAAGEVVDRHTGDARIDLRHKDALRGLGLEQVAGVLPVLGQLPDEAADQVRAWILGIAAQVAEASHDAGETEEINAAERRALDAISGVLSA